MEGLPRQYKEAKFWEWLWLTHGCTQRLVREARTLAHRWHMLPFPGDYSGHLAHTLHVREGYKSVCSDSLGLCNLWLGRAAPVHFFAAGVCTRTLGAEV